jgi:hypothetical protein
MTNIEYTEWLIGIVAAAESDKASGRRRFGEDFPMRVLPNSLNPQGAVNLAATIYNVVYEGWPE